MLLVPAFLSFLQLLRWSVRSTHAREIPPARPHGDRSRSRARGCHTGMPGAPARSRPNSGKVQLFRETSSTGAPSSPLYFSSHSGKSRRWPSVVSASPISSPFSTPHSANRTSFPLLWRLCFLYLEAALPSS